MRNDWINEFVLLILEAFKYNTAIVDIEVLMCKFYQFGEEQLCE